MPQTIAYRIFNSAVVKLILISTCDINSWIYICASNLFVFSNFKAFEYMHTYIYNSSLQPVRIIDLVSHTTYVMCVNFIHKWRELRLRTTDF